MAHDLFYAETAEETLEQLEPEDARRIIRKLEEVIEFPGHFLRRLQNHPGYRLRVGDHRVLLDWDKDAEHLYVIDVFERRTDYRELGTYREVWGTWRERDSV